VKGRQNGRLLVFITDIHCWPADSAGLIVTNTFYWDRTTRRAFSKRFEAVEGHSSDHGPGCMRGTHYSRRSKVVEDDGTRHRQMRNRFPTIRCSAGDIRADGRKIHPAYLVEVSAVGVQRPWDTTSVRRFRQIRRSGRSRRKGRAVLLAREVISSCRRAPLVAQRCRRDENPRVERARRAAPTRLGQRFMTELFGVPTQALFGQLLIGLINGAFYAMLSLGLAVIFGLLNIINFTHGAQYMMGAFCSYFLLQYAGIGYWWALIIAPIVVGATGVVIERTMLARLYKLDPLRAVADVRPRTHHPGVFTNFYGSSGLPYRIPDELSGGINLGFMFLPKYRAWVIIASVAVCAATWYVIERTKLGSYLRAATENRTLVQAFGVNVPRMITLTYGFGVGLAAFAGVMAAPIYQVNPQMGANMIIVVFAVVVIGGMGSILGAIVSGFALGLIEGLTKVFYPEASATVIFVIMALVLLVKPAGLGELGRGDEIGVARATAPRRTGHLSDMTGVMAAPRGAPCRDLPGVPDEGAVLRLCCAFNCCSASAVCCRSAAMPRDRGLRVRTRVGPRSRSANRRIRCSVLSPVRWRKAGVCSR
jgi:branched-chain amino acid transport system permease protein